MVNVTFFKGPDMLAEFGRVSEFCESENVEVYLSFNKLIKRNGQKLLSE